MAKSTAKNYKKLIGGSQYQGKYVVFGSLGSKNIVASGPNLGTVIKKARSQGIDVPAVVFVPKKGTTCIY